jgi:alpha-2-macroglobulin
VPITNRRSPTWSSARHRPRQPDHHRAKEPESPAVERTLTITATPSKPKYLPGEKGSFDVFAVDSKGKPVEADLSFGEVDEALYSVRPDESGDIVNFFYPKREVYLEPQTSFEFLLLRRGGIEEPAARGLNGLYHPRLAQVKPGSDLVVPKVRKAFPDTAYWNPNVRTGPTATRASSSTSLMRSPPGAPPSAP